MASLVLQSSHGHLLMKRFRRCEPAAGSTKHPAADPRAAGQGGTAEDQAANPHDREDRKRYLKAPPVIPQVQSVRVQRAARAFDIPQAQRDGYSYGPRALVLYVHRCGAVLASLALIAPLV